VEQVIYEDMYRLERTHWWFRARRDILSGIIRQNVRPGGSILDVGCGTGFVLEALRDAYEVHGIDDAEIAVRLCHEKGLDFVERGVLGQTRLSRSSYDLVTFLDVDGEVLVWLADFTVDLAQHHARQMVLQRDARRHGDAQGHYLRLAVAGEPQWNRYRWSGIGGGG